MRGSGYLERPDRPGAMMRVLRVMFAAAFAGGAVFAFAAPAPPEPAPEPLCQPMDGVLAANATLAGAAGAYRLTMVGPQTDGKNRAANGSLLLWPLDAEAFAPAATPLWGATDINLPAVGAQRVGDPDSRDPLAPGVLVLESSQGDAPRILLRFGSDANQADSPLYDGGFTVLQVSGITSSGFTGDWRSGVEGEFASGYFCARRIGEAPKPGSDLAVDHGNDPGTATPVAIPSTTAGTLATGDQDYFLIEIGEPGSLWLESKGRTDTYGILYRSDGREIARNDDDGTGRNFLISRVSLDVGAYYLLVRAYHPMLSGAYSLSVSGKARGCRAGCVPECVPETLEVDDGAPDWRVEAAPPRAYGPGLQDCGKKS